MALYAARALDGRSRWLGGQNASVIKDTLADAKVFCDRGEAERVARLVRVPCTVVEV